MTVVTQTVVIQDGRLRPDGKVALDADDPALVRGLAVFETLRSWEGRVSHLELHLDRLQGSAAALDLPMPERALLRAEVKRAVALLGEEAAVRITLTAGGSRIVRASPLPAPLLQARCASRRHPDHPWLTGRAKHISRAAWVVAVREAGTDEVLWVDGEGLLLEGTWSNVFAVRDGSLYTPADDGRILPGITRQTVLTAARALGLPHQEGPTPAAGPWDELYLSSSLKILCPIVELDGRPALGMGPVGRRLVAAYEATLRRSGDAAGPGAPASRPR